MDCSIPVIQKNRLYIQYIKPNLKIPDDETGKCTCPDGDTCQECPFNADVNSEYDIENDFECVPLAREWGRKVYDKTKMINEIMK